MNSGIYDNLIAQLDKLKKHNRQGSYKTRERHYEAMQRFCRYLAGEFRLEKLSNIAPKHLYAYVKHMQETGKAASTIKTDLAAIRFWHDKLSEAKYRLPSNELLNLAKRSLGKVDRTWPEEAYERMLEICNANDRLDYAAALCIAQHAGLRIHECFRIDTAMARKAVREKAITMKGKGGRVRTVPIPEIVCGALIKLLSDTPSGRKLFVPEGMQTHTAIKVFQKFLLQHRFEVQCGEEALPLHFHGLRHGFAAGKFETLRGRGLNDSEARKQVSRLLGHNRPEVTGIYLASIKGKPNNHTEL